MDAEFPGQLSASAETAVVPVHLRKRHSLSSSIVFQLTSNSKSISYIIIIIRDQKLVHNLVIFDDLNAIIKKKLKLEEEHNQEQMDRQGHAKF